MAGNPAPTGHAKKGEVRNPNGRPPKNLALNDLMSKFAKEKVMDIDTGKKTRRLQLLVKKMWEFALAGDKAICTYMLDRLGGKAVQMIEIDDGKADEVSEQLKQLREAIIATNEIKR